MNVLRKNITYMLLGAKMVLCALGGLPNYQPPALAHKTSFLLLII
jgi:hypothetical protein